MEVPQVLPVPVLKREYIRTSENLVLVLGSTAVNLHRYNNSTPVLNLDPVSGDDPDPHKLYAVRLQNRYSSIFVRESAAARKKSTSKALDSLRSRWRRFTPPGPQNEYVCGGPINRGRLHIHGIQAVTGSRLASRLASGRNQASADPEAAEPADTPRSSERGLTIGSCLQRGLNGAGIADACRVMPRRTPTTDA